MASCEKHHRALFVIIHDKELPVTRRVLYHFLSLWRSGKDFQILDNGGFSCSSEFLLT